MESDSSARFATASRRHQSTLKSRHDLYLGFEDVDGDNEEPRTEFPCPFCPEVFDIVGLCCHVDDEHQVDAKNGVCPVCTARVGMDLVGHVTKQHGNFFKLQRRRRFRRGSSGSHSTLSLLRKESREGSLQALLGGSTYTVPPPNAAADHFLSSLIYPSPVVDSSRDMQPESLDEESMTTKGSDVKVVASVEPSLSEKDQRERACRSKFVQGLLLSTIFDDDGTLRVK